MYVNVPCDDCGNMIANTSKLCPYCGSQSPNKVRDYFYRIVGLLFVVGLVWFFFVRSPSDDGTQPIPPMIAQPSGNDDDNLPETAQPVPSVAATNQSVDAQTADSQAVEGDVSEQAATETMSESTAIGLALDKGYDQHWNDGQAEGVVRVMTTKVDGKERCLIYSVERYGMSSGRATVCKGQSGAWELQ